MDLPGVYFGRSAASAESVAERRGLLDQLCMQEVLCSALLAFAAVSHDVTLTERQWGFNATASRAAMADPGQRLAILSQEMTVIPPTVPAQQPPTLPVNIFLPRTGMVLGGDAGLVLVLRAARFLMKKKHEEILGWLGLAPPAWGPKGAKAKRDTKRQGDPREGRTSRELPDRESGYATFFIAIHQRRYDALQNAQLPTKGYEPMPPPSGKVDLDALLDNIRARALPTVIEQLQCHVQALTAGRTEELEASMQMFSPSEEPVEVPALESIAIAEALLLALFLEGLRPTATR